MKKLLLVLFAVFCIGMIIPEDFRMPVEGAGKGSYNKKSFWYYPWGSSVTHKGVDVFAKKGTVIHPSTIGIAVVLPEFPKGGKCAIVIGPKWRLHYYAHMDEVSIPFLSFVTHDSKLGTVGNSGNAAKTPAHLHYSIGTLIPYPWRIDDSRQGWKKIFYLDPVEKLNSFFEKK